MDWIIAVCIIIVICFFLSLCFVLAIDSLYDRYIKK